MDSEGWDERYAATELVWSKGPNAFLANEVLDLAPGTALDLACGEGRNAIWLAKEGWQVTGVDFSPVGINKARRLAAVAELPEGGSVVFEVGDATTWRPDGPGFDLVIIFYLHLPPAQRREAHLRAAEALAPGGTLLVVGHHRDNLERGVGGPQDPELLLEPRHVESDLETRDLTVVASGEIHRRVEVDGASRVAIDCLVRMTRPA